MPRLYLFVLCILFFLTISCSSHPSRPLTPPSFGVHQLELGKAGGEHTWSSTTGSSQGQLIVRTFPNENSEWKILFSEYVSQTSSFPLQIIVSDKDCDSGYKVTIEHFPEKRTAYREYMDFPAGLNEALELSVSWGDANRFTVTVNGQSFSGSYYDSVSLFSVVNNYGQQDIQLEYSRN